MRYAILSDIHGNLEALQTVLAAVRRLSIDRYICLGDSVGYGADPKACLETLRLLNPLGVLGNHDAAACGLDTAESFNERARQAIFWTEGLLDQAEKEYLAALPLTRLIDEIALVHGSLSAPPDWEYVLSPADARPSFNRLPGRLCFFGHSHLPGFFREKEGVIDFVPDEEVRLAPGCRYLINAGSVGQPRDRDPRASFILFDDRAEIIRIVRVAYPIRKAQEKILAAGLPRFLAERLAVGR